MKFKSILVSICLLFSAASSAAAFTEPHMADYTSFPLITAETVQPNIMIILDNSGSMNSMAYSDTYAGEPYGSIRSYRISSNGDDWEERTAAGVGPAVPGDGRVCENRRVY